MLEQLKGIAAKHNGDFVEKVRLDILLGENDGKLRTVVAALRLYTAYVTDVLQKCAMLPPVKDEVVAFSLAFRNAGTYSNYVSALRTACQIAKVSSGSLYGPEIRRASAEIAKRALPQAPKKFLSCNIVSRLSKSALANGCKLESALYLLAYSFLLRVPSEALPIVIGSESDLRVKPKSVEPLLVVTESELVLRLAKRKNCKDVSTLRRTCLCKNSKSMCCFHVVGQLVKELPVGTKLFDGLSRATALSNLRRRLTKVGVENPEAYRLHDMRRGHAQDLVIRGASLSTILRAGGWKSSAF